MTRIVTLDFTDAPAAQGGGGFDHVPPGRYAVRLNAIDDSKSKASSKRMFVAIWEVATGTESGKSLIDRFVLEGDQKFGRQRLNALLAALGIQTGDKAVRLDLDKLIGKVCETVVVDDKMPANDTYSERTISKIQAYYPLSSPNGKKSEPAPVQSAPVQAAPVAAVATADEMPFEIPVQSPVSEPPLASEDPVLEVASTIDGLFE